MVWSEERRQKQREIINRNRPWEKSTGPRSRKGKILSSRNAYKHGNRGRGRKALRRALRLNKAFVEAIKLYTVQELLEKSRTNELLKDRLNSMLTPPTPGRESERTIRKNALEIKARKGKINATSI